MEEITPTIHTLRHPANFLVTGATSSGKTSFVYKLLDEWPFAAELGTITYMFNVWQPLFEKFLARFDKIKFVQGLNEKDIENEQNWAPLEPNTINVCIVDDLADQAVRSESFARLFTVYGHHRGIINIFLSQNPYFKGPLSPTINRNTHYFVLCKTPHLNVVDTLNRQLYGNNGPIRNAYEKTMNERPYNYLLIDVFSDDVANRLRSNIFSNEGPMIIWRPLS